MKYLLLGVLGTLILSCSTPVKKKPAASQLFPFGAYEENITLKIFKALPNSKEKTFETHKFSGVVKSTKDGIKLMGLSPLGTTVFEVSEEKKSGGIKVAIHIEKLKKFENRFKKFYRPLKKLLAMSKKPQVGDLETIKWDSQGRPKEIFILDEKDPIIVKVLKYDINHIPQNLLFQSKDFEVTVKITDYDI